MVTVDGAPAQGEVAEALNAETFGIALTVNVADEQDDTVLLQPSLLVIDVNAALVEPVAVNLAAGIVNVPVLPVITSVAVLAVDVLAPLSE